jgi:hypothetical protein
VLRFAVHPEYLFVVWLLLAAIANVLSVIPIVAYAGVISPPKRSLGRWKDPKTDFVARGSTRASTTFFLSDSALH